MINSVRNTVLSVINKNNYGYISPADFNLFAKQAQLDIFEDYFYKLNYQVNKENARMSGTGLADIQKQYDEVISTFSTTATLAHVGSNRYTLPSDYYLLNVIEYSPTGVEVEKIAENKIRNLTASTLMAPSTAFPLYVHRGDVLDVYPTHHHGSTLIVDALLHKAPEETPSGHTFTLSGGEPVFDQTALDYQDFELPDADEPTLVMKILQYAGISIREGDVYQAANAEDQQENAAEK
jgi:hypothetical protein